jgi:uncharacterized membrane protein YdjX (TVP38/TMEM64 family)
MESPNPDNSREALTAAPEPENHLASLAVWLGARPDMPDRTEYLFFLGISGIFLLGMLAWLGYIYLEPVRERLYQLVLERERIRALMSGADSWGPVLFILAQALQVITIFWPVPLELAGGFLFGWPWGLVYSVMGLVLGSMLAFLLGRWLERRFVSRLVHPKTMKNIRELLKREGTLAGFLIFLIPGIPKDFVCYFFGLTRISLAFFLVAATLARLPGTILMTLQGAQVYQGHYGITVGLLVSYAAVAGLLYRYRESLYHWLGRWHHEEE